jgi:YgiT-type zinc finger domain-containing protein
MICLICRQTELVYGFITVELERGETRVIVNSVPAWACPDCRDAVLDEDVAVRLLDAAEDVAVMGMCENVFEYEKFLN